MLYVTCGVGECTHLSLTECCGGDVYRYAFVRAPAVAPGFLTDTETVPLPAGVRARMLVLLATVTLVAAAPPKLTIAPVAKFVPVIVTDLQETHQAQPYQRSFSLRFSSRIFGTVEAYHLLYYYDQVSRASAKRARLVISGNTSSC